MTTETKLEVYRDSKTCVDCISNLIIETGRGCCGLISREIADYLERAARHLDIKDGFSLALSPLQFDPQTNFSVPQNLLGS